MPAVTRFALAFGVAVSLAAGTSAASHGSSSTSAPGAPAQGGATQNPRSAQIDLIRVDVSARDAAGQPVADLRPSELRVREDGVEQSIQTFAFIPSANGTGAYYVVGYPMTSPGGSRGFHRIDVTTTRPGVVIVARSGYDLGQDVAAGAFPETTPGLVAPVARTTPAPHYTSDAMRAKIQGVVVIEAVVGTDGAVTGARVLTSLDAQYGLDQEALRAARAWTFTPGTLDGRVVPVIVRLDMAFRLH